MKFRSPASEMLRKRRNLIKCKEYLIISGLVIFLFCLMGFYAYGTKDSTVVLISEKERVTTHKTSRFLIWTDSEVFQCRDSFFYLKFNSSDIYGKFKVGKKYKVDYYGFRVPFFSMYSNILSAKEVK